MRNASSFRSVACVVALSGCMSSVSAPQDMKLWHTVDTAGYPGMFPCPGDLDGDGNVDFLLYRQGPQTTPGYLVAVDFEGKKLWEMGDPAVTRHLPDGFGKEPALRGIALVFDIDQDGSQEVITEFWKDQEPMLYVLDGATGKVERSRPSPLDLKVRSGRRSRCHPLGRIAYLQGKEHPPALVLKYEASNHVAGHAVALDPELNTIWHLIASPHAIGHIPTVGDVDADGRDEILLGTLLADDDGTVLWQRDVSRHADCTAVADLLPNPGQEVFVSVCGTGPAFCLSAAGKVLWEKTVEEVPHGQGIWTGDFIAEEPGTELVILKSGHVGDFLTVRSTDGAQLAEFQHRTVFRGYPDFPVVVRWKREKEDSLWIPIDRMLVDGFGRVVASLGPRDQQVKAALRWGTTKQHIATQAFALDLCGDERDELILYQPYNGRAILVFTQSDSAGENKPFRVQRNAYNIRSYF